MQSALPTHTHSVPSSSNPLGSSPKVWSPNAIPSNWVPSSLTSRMLISVLQTSCILNYTVEILVTWAVDFYFHMHVMLVSLITNQRVKILLRGKGFVSNDFVVKFSPDFLQFCEKNVQCNTDGFWLCICWLWGKCLIYKCNECIQVGAFWMNFVLFSKSVFGVRSPKMRFLLLMYQVYVFSTARTLNLKTACTEQQWLYNKKKHPVTA